MLAADPDEYNRMVWLIEDLEYRQDDLSAELKAVQTSLDKSAQAIKSVVDQLVGIKAKMDSLPTCDNTTLDDQISGLRQDLDVVLRGLQPEVIS
jgi:hypothetical protein